tara:strand:- start:54 stop:878 length:825 start_codon:yes stop_codon:yes gene_type:complete
MAFLVTGAIVAGSLAVAGGAAKLGMSLAGRKKRIAEQRAAKEEFDKMKGEYQNLDTSNLAAGVRNPYENLENTFEDLTVNQQQAQFEAQQVQQSQANIMQNLQGAAGGSGIAALAQTLANQGQLSLQKASASIGMQEAQNQKLAAQQAAKIQQLEGQGELAAEKMRQAGAKEARSLDYQKTSTLLGMSQQRKAAADQARRQAMADQMSAVGDIASAGADMALNIAGAKGLQPKLGGTGGGGTNTPVFQSGVYGPNPEYDTDGDGIPNLLDPDTK